MKECKYIQNISENIIKKLLSSQKEDENNKIQITRNGLISLIENTINEISDLVNREYTHFVVRKDDNSIINGYDYNNVDAQDRIEYTKQDLIDNGMDPKKYKLVGKKFLIKNGIDPFDYNNWTNPSMDENKCNGKCIHKIDGFWRIKSGKTGKLWPAHYNTKEDAENALKAYHVNN